MVSSIKVGREQVLGVEINEPWQRVFFTDSCDGSGSSGVACPCTAVPL